MKGEGVFPGESRKELKRIAREIEKENRKYGKEFVAIPLVGDRPTLIATFRNRYHLAAMYQQGTWIRLSINRTGFDPDTNRWYEGISWDTLMKIKTAVGYGDRDAVEIYPKDDDVVNVANIRHLFILPEDHNINCIWRN